MKRTLSLLLAVMMMLPVLCLLSRGISSPGVPARADNGGIEPTYCVTWLLRPERSEPRKGIINYVAEYYADGKVPTPPTEIPDYEIDDYYYQPLGWRQISGVGVINDYFDSKPALSPGDTFVQEPFVPINGHDAVYVPVYRKHYKNYAVNNDRVVNIEDVTALLDYLSGSSTHEDSVGIARMLSKYGFLSIRQVTEILNYLVNGSIPA